MGRGTKHDQSREGEESRIGKNHRTREREDDRCETPEFKYIKFILKCEYLLVRNHQSTWLHIDFGIFITCKN